MRLGLELSAFPPDVRHMTLRDFCEIYNGDLNVFIAQQSDPTKCDCIDAHTLTHRRTAVAATKSSAPTGGTHFADSRSLQGKAMTPGRNRQARNGTHPYSPAVHRPSTVAQTPRLNPRLPSTPSQKNVRQPSRHESIMSINGSPLLNPYTADGDDASRRSTRIMAARESGVLSVPIMRGDETTELTIQLEQSPSRLKALDSPAKRQVQNQLAKLQQQLANLMESIK
jgi:hypothetical protein